MYLRTVPIAAVLVLVGTVSSQGEKASPKPLHDLYGDELPYGSVVRLGTLRLREGGTESLAFSPNGKWLAAWGRGGAVVSETATGKTLAKLIGEGEVPALRFDPDGRSVTAVTKWSPSLIRTWRLLPERTRLFEKFDRTLDGAYDFSPDGKVLATNFVRFWRVTDGEPHGFLGEGKGGCADLRHSPDGRWLTKAGNGAVEVWDIAAKSAKQFHAFDKDEIVRLAFSPDSKRLA
ncbi:MAG: hypothetical protein WD176_07360, partial [Pirellulales bacterium]